MFAKALSGWTLTTFSIVFQVRKGSCSAKRQAHSELLNLHTSGELRFIRCTCNVQHAQGAPCMQKKKMHSFQKPFKEEERRKKTVLHAFHPLGQQAAEPPSVDSVLRGCVESFQGGCRQWSCFASQQAHLHQPQGTSLPRRFPLPTCSRPSPGVFCCRAESALPSPGVRTQPSPSIAPVAAGWAWGMQGMGAQGLGKPRSLRDESQGRWTGHWHRGTAQDNISLPAELTTLGLGAPLAIPNTSALVRELKERARTSPWSSL